MKARIFWFLLLLATLLWAPFWLGLVVLAGAVFYGRLYLLALFFAILNDLLFSFAGMSWHASIIYTLIVLGMIGVSILIAPYIRGVQYEYI